MDTFFLIYVLALIVIMYITYRIVKSLVKAFVIVSIVLTIFGLIFGVLVYNDLNEWKNNFSDTNLGFVFEKNNKSLDAFEIVMKNGTINGTTNKDVKIIQESYDSNNIDLIKNNSNVFKVFVFDISSLDNKNISTNISENNNNNNNNLTLNLNNKQIQSILMSDNPKEKIMQINPEFNFNEIDGSIDNDMIKSIIFFNMLNEADSKTKTEILSSLYIYPQDMVTRALNLVSTKFLPSVFN